MAIHDPITTTVVREDDVTLGVVMIACSNRSFGGGKGADGCVRRHMGWFGNGKACKAN